MWFVLSMMKFQNLLKISKLKWETFHLSSFVISQTITTTKQQRRWELFLSLSLENKVKEWKQQPKKENVNFSFLLSRFVMVRKWGWRDSKCRERRVIHVLIFFSFEDFRARSDDIFRQQRPQRIVIRLLRRASRKWKITFHFSSRFFQFFVSLTASASSSSENKQIFRVN